jgi:hypothetical protein
MIKFNMLPVLTTVVLFVMSLTAPEASRVLPPTSSSTISQKDLTSDHFNNLVSPALLHPQLYMGPVPPSGPNLSPQIPASTTAPLLGSLLKSPPPRTMLNGDTTSDRFNNVVSPLLRRQLLKGRVPPSDPNPATNNPTSTTSRSKTRPRTMPNGNTSIP